MISAWEELNEEGRAELIEALNTFSPEVDFIKVISENKIGEYLSGLHSSELDVEVHKEGISNLLKKELHDLVYAAKAIGYEIEKREYKKARSEMEAARSSLNKILTLYGIEDVHWVELIIRGMWSYQGDHLDL